MDDLHIEPEKESEPKSKTYLILVLASILILLIGANIWFALQISHPAQTVEQVADSTKSQPLLNYIQVQVLNGSGVPKLGDKFSRFLRSKNVDVVEIGNYIVSDIDYTMIIDRTGKRDKALAIGAMLGVKSENVFTQQNKNYFLDVSVIIGRDFRKLTFEN